ncbi:hypothetical protein CSUI_003722 [Cystoisospora suis]|uniref:Uncharacterized protein n=1 Tax=Cystoisospora suis TaxID=483139 RepID=A0A2C6KEI9_9APIC|nr:hypothetical protein CSUI_003722 [Cystoisospora suis]
MLPGTGPTLNARTLIQNADYQERQEHPCDPFPRSAGPCPRMSLPTVVNFRDPQRSPATGSIQPGGWAHSSAAFRGCLTPKSIYLTEKVTPSYSARIRTLPRPSAISLEQTPANSSACDSHSTSVCTARHHETVAGQDGTKDTPRDPPKLPATKVGTPESPPRTEKRPESATDPGPVRHPKPVHAREDGPEASPCPDAKRLCNRAADATGEQPCSHTSDSALPPADRGDQADEQPSSHTGHSALPPPADCEHSPDAESAEKSEQGSPVPCTQNSQPPGQCTALSSPRVKESESHLRSDLAQDSGERHDKELPQDPSGETARRKKGFCAAREIVKLLSG